MTKLLQSVRGMDDMLPENAWVWQYVEATLRRIAGDYGYSEIRFPVVESTELFKRSVGEVTDIVEKQMYTFADRNGDSLTLRPEGTACCVRAGIQHGLFYNQTQRLWYLGPIFRHERPQKGRYRQFYQFGIEAFGMEGPDIDAEMILMTARMWKALGVLPYVTLHLNSLGTSEARAHYRDRLVAYLTEHQDKLDADSQRRLHTNPLRVLDSKNPEMQPIIAGAPQLLDSVDDISREHFAYLCNVLDAAGVQYVVDPHLVRGLDYYSRTVFEWVTDKLGAQSAVCAGGRFDGLVELLGGRTTPAIGFALGMERLIALLTDLSLLPEHGHAVDVYMVMAGKTAQQRGLLLAEELRDRCPEMRVVSHCGVGSFKRQFKKADKLGARWALVVGEDELADDTVTVKNLRNDIPQKTMPVAQLFSYLKGEHL